MKLKALFFALLAAVTVHDALAEPAVQTSASLKPASIYLLPGGGTATFTLTVTNYPFNASAIGCSVELPAGWAYTGGTNEPDVKPAGGSTGTLEWAFITIPNSPTFTFTATYPAGITTAPTLSAEIIARFDGNKEQVAAAVDALAIATAPAFANTSPDPATYGSPFEFDIVVTSPIDVSVYEAFGLPSGLTLTWAKISGSPAATGTFPVTLKATNAAGTTSKNVTITVAPATASISLSNLSQIYSGSPKSATVSTIPAGVPVSVTYDGETTPPTDAGTYAVAVISTSPNYTSSASGTLTIQKAPQTVTFTQPSSVAPRRSIDLSASSNTGEPVTFSMQSGNATINGSKLTSDGVGQIVVRATAAGTDNYEEGFAERTIQSAKLVQTITFAALPDRDASDDPFALSASASSGLNVSFSVISGSPAQLSGGNLSLTGAAGTVTVRASQAGDETYLAADDVVRSFNVWAQDDRVFFGSFFSTNATPASGRRALSVTPMAVEKVGEVAAVLRSQANAGSLLIVAPAIQINALVDFTLQLDGSFVASVEQSGTTPKELTVHGQLAGTVLTGTIEGTGFSFSTEIEPPDGPSAPAAGLYQSSALETAEGTTYTVIGSNNNVLVLAITPTLIVGGKTTLAENGTFQFEGTADTGVAVTIQAAVDTPTTTVAGTILVPQQPSIGFAGLETTTSRTDRLLGLSSRGRVGTGDKVLISGVVIGGNQPKPVMIRAVGPSLLDLGVANALLDPRIYLFKGSTLIAENDNWATNDNATEIAATAQRIGAFGLPSDSKDAILVRTLEPGAYTVHIHGGEGVALAEIYDASENPQSEYQRLVDIATRGEVGTGENVLIGGLAISGNSPKRVLIRGVGPALTAQGVSGALADPVVRVYRGNTLIGQNDNWSADATQAAQITAAETTTGAFHLQSGSKDAAILLTLAPGNYTVHVAGVNNTTGVALVEIYEVAD